MYKTAYTVVDGKVTTLETEKWPDNITTEAVTELAQLRGVSTIKMLEELAGQKVVRFCRIYGVVRLCRIYGFKWADVGMRRDVYIHTSKLLPTPAELLANADITKER